MNQRVFDRLRIAPGDRVADIGAGTGLFLRSLVRHVTGDNPIVCIDPSRPAAGFGMSMHRREARNRAGQEMFTKLDAQRTDLLQTLLRISGASRC